MRRSNRPMREARRSRQRRLSTERRVRLLSVAEPATSEAAVCVRCCRLRSKSAAQHPAPLNRTPCRHIRHYHNWTCAPVFAVSTKCQTLSKRHTATKRQTDTADMSVRLFVSLSVCLVGGVWHYGKVLTVADSPLQSQVQFSPTVLSSTTRM